MGKSNSDALIEMLADVDTPADLQVKIMEKLLDEQVDNSFFIAMFKEMFSYGACPSCGHEDHWLVPERDLNQIGYVTADHDPRVKRATTPQDCPDYGEACIKKKISV